MAGGMKSKLLVFLLVLSLVANAYFVLFEEQPSFEGDSGNAGPYKSFKRIIENLRRR